MYFVIEVMTRLRIFKLLIKIEKEGLPIGTV